jgi:four helix bundle protein
LAVDVFKLTKSGEIEKEWSIRDQMRRAALSIPSNIAEGYERNTKAEFVRFLHIAKGSCAELRTQLYVAKALKLLPNKDVDKIIDECKHISSQIQNLIKYLRK